MRATHFRPWFAACLLLGIVMVAEVRPVCAQGWPEERRTGVFHCHANFRLTPHEPLLGQLGQLQQDVGQALALTPTDEPIHLFLFNSSNTYRNYMQRYFPQVPYRRALFIKGRGPGMVFAFADEAFETDVRHECTHAVLHAILPMVPLWLDEGLAEYFEVEQPLRARRNPHHNATKWNVRFGKITSMQALEQLRSLDQMGGVEYRHSWAWVHFMLHGPPEAKEELLAYLADIQAHTATAPLSERLRRRLPNFEALAAEHFKQW